MERYILVDHTADMMVRAFGDTLEECFGNAAYALFDQTVDLSDISAVGLYSVPSSKVKVYLNAGSSVGVIGENSIVVNVSRR